MTVICSTRNSIVKEWSCRAAAVATGRVSADTPCFGRDRICQKNLTRFRYLYPADHHGKRTDDLRTLFDWNGSKPGIGDFDK
jgi:hypothetical protein